MYSDQKPDFSHFNMLLKSAYEAVEKYEQTNQISFPDEVLQKDKSSIFFFHVRECYIQWKASKEIIFNYASLPAPELQLLSQINTAYSIFKDRSSKELFDLIMKFRIVFILTNHREISKTIFPCKAEHKDPYMKLKVQKEGQPLSLFEVDGYTIESTLPEISETWVYENYLLEGKCEPGANDIVIDAGGYMGETSIWFADKVGPKGKVYSFELMPSHAAMIRSNLERNQLEGRVQIINKGLWSENTFIYTKQEGPATSCMNNAGDSKVEVVSLDTFAVDAGVEQINYIKMDIEGAEINALRGAMNVIKKHKPRLAICVYHNYEDMIVIPAILKSLVPEYNIYLSQKVGYPFDTVLLATL